MKPTILIPTCRPIQEIYLRVCECADWSAGCVILATCRDNSAARNRNLALSLADTDIVIMVDDDISGFHAGWVDMMIAPLQDPNVMLVSARLIKPDGSLAYMTGECYDVSAAVVEVPRREVPTACVAFRMDGTTFDEGYLGSGFEDNDFCMQLKAKYPGGRVIIANECRLIHENEMKNQASRYQQNRAYFNYKWGEQR
jgi:hypothetical protein